MQSIYIVYTYFPYIISTQLEACSGLLENEVMDTQMIYVSENETELQQGDLLGSLGSGT